MVSQNFFAGIEVWIKGNFQTSLTAMPLKN